MVMYDVNDYDNYIDNGDDIDSDDNVWYLGYWMTYSWGYYEYDYAKS